MCPSHIQSEHVHIQSISGCGFSLCMWLLPVGVASGVALLWEDLIVGPGGFQSGVALLWEDLLVGPGGFRNPPGPTIKSSQSKATPEVTPTGRSHTQMEKSHPHGEATPTYPLGAGSTHLCSSCLSSSRCTEGGHCLYLNLRRSVGRPRPPYPRSYPPKSGS